MSWDLMELRPPLTDMRREQLSRFLRAQGLSYEGDADYTVMLADEYGAIVASGALTGNVIRYMAVDEKLRGEGVTARMMTALHTEAYAAGRTRLFLFTKPGNAPMFRDFGFFPISQTDNMLLMENSRDGIRRFVGSLERGKGSVQGAIVANCNPFTLGHQYLMETAAARCDTLHIFVLSEDKSAFSAAERFEMVKKGITQLHNALVHPTSNYLISSVTFPTYFLKDNALAARESCMLDLAVFCDYFAPALSITRRFVGCEPFCRVTAEYNEAMKTYLPERGIEVSEIKRKEIDGEAVSASRVRSLLERGRMEEALALLPQTSWPYCLNRYGRG